MDTIHAQALREILGAWQLHRIIASDVGVVLQERVQRFRHEQMPPQSIRQIVFGLTSTFNVLSALESDATLRNQFADVEAQLELGLQTSKQTGVELRTLLSAECPGQTIIGFVLGEEVAPGGSPLVQARNRAASKQS